MQIENSDLKKNSIVIQNSKKCCDKNVDASIIIKKSNKGSKRLNSGRKLIPYSECALNTKKRKLSEIKTMIKNKFSLSSEGTKTIINDLQKPILIEKNLVRSKMILSKLQKI